MWVPFLRSFPRNEAYQLFSGRPKCAVLGGGQEVYVETVYVLSPFLNLGVVHGRGFSGKCLDSGSISCEEVSQVLWEQTHQNRENIESLCKTICTKVSQQPLTKRLLQLLTVRNTTEKLLKIAKLFALFAIGVPQPTSFGPAKIHR